MLQLTWLDAVQLTRDRVALWALAIGLAITAVAVWSGHAWLDKMSQERAAFLQDGDTRLQAFRENLLKGNATPEQLALAPVRLSLPLAYPVPELADFSIGRSDIEPATAEVRVRYRSDTLFRNYQTDNPERLVRGRIDLSFVVVVVAPLLLIALGYGLFSGDRDRGTAQLVLAQAGSPARILAARSLNRVALVALPVLLGGITLVAIGPQPEERALPALQWLGVALLCLLFWQAAILCINALRIRSETAALVLVGIWMVQVFIAPAIINATSHYLSPPPSRLSLIVESRSAEIAATGTYENDHPELAADPALPLAEQYRRTVARNYGIGMAIENQLAPLMRSFDDQLSRQMAFVETAQFVSPPMMFSSLLATIAGTDTLAYARHRKAAFDSLAAFKQSIGTLLASGKSFSVADLDALPRYAAPPHGGLPLAPLLASLAVTLVLGFLAWRLYRRTLSA